MPGGLMLSSCSASHQNSTISCWQGSAIAGCQPFSSSTALSRSWIGRKMSQPLAHMVHQKLNQVWFIFMPPT